MKKEMLINANQAEECRIAIVEDGVLEELYVERASQESYVGNIYKGKIVNIEASIQAAFIDFGIGRNGFLHVSDVDPVYFKHLLPKDALAALEAEENEAYGVDRTAAPERSRDRDRKGRGRDRDRGPRTRESEVDAFKSAPPELTSWLEPPPLPQDEPAVEPFGSMTDDEAPTDDFDGEVYNDEPSLTILTPVPEDSNDENDFEDDFGSGLIDAPEPMAPPKTNFTNTAPAVMTPLSPPPLPPAPALEDDDFGDFGSGLEDDADTLVQLTPEALAPEPTDEKPQPRGRAKAPRKTKADDAEAKKPTRRTPRKKTDVDDAPGEQPPPLTMGGAERRTSAGDDDEPEIRPFFDGASDDFDPDAPNDRFQGEAVEDTQTFEAEDESFEETSDDDAPEGEPAIAPMPLGRGFNDPEDGEYQGSDERRNNDRGGRGGRSNDRGPRSNDRGPRSNDRGPRSNDRGPRTSGGGGGGGGRPARDKGVPRMPIEKIFKRGQEVIVQVIKEGMGTKGPTLSTYVSIAGRYLVLMPSLDRVGVSRKIEDLEARRRLRDIMTDLTPPKGVGFIVRTAAVDREASELQADLAYLLRLWQVVVRRIKRVAAPVEVYRESDMITRTIRDVFTKDVDTIWVDDETAYQHAAEFLQIVMPRFAERIRHHNLPEPLFQKYRVEDEIAKLNHKRLDLPRGGSIIIEQTEALVAIDVNSGNFRADNNPEETSYQMNLIAAREIARQLRLRDLGGVIVNDFIDMRSESHRRKVEDALRDALRRDKARTKILRISQFGIIEMTRQRIQPSLKKRIYNECTHCKGTGYVRTNETTGIEVMRMLQIAAHRSAAAGPGISSVQLSVCTEAAMYLLNRKRREIAAIEEKAQIEITITGVAGVSPDHLEVKAYDRNGTEARLINAGPPPKFFAAKAPRQLSDRRYNGPSE